MRVPACSSPVSGYDPIGLAPRGRTRVHNPRRTTKGWFAMNVDAKHYKETPERRTKLTLQRGNFYFAMGFVLVAGLIAVVGLGVAGISSLGIFTVSTAMAMTAIAITVLALVSFVTLTTLRRTVGLLSYHENVIAEQARVQAGLVARMQSQYQSEQLTRDSKQSADIASLSAVQDASFINQQTEAERRRVRIGPRSALLGHDVFEGGQVHPVRDVEGIGAHYGGLLDSLGIKDTKRLWNADSSYVANALKVTPGLVENWQCMAELMAVNGIGKQYAELLVRAGVPSIRSLCAETPQKLLDRIIRLERREGNRIQGNTIGIKAVQTWIHAAQAHSPGVGAETVGRFRTPSG